MSKHKYSTRIAEEEDAIYLAPKLRQADIDEIKAASGMEPLEAMLDSIRHSGIAKVALVDEEVVCIFGVASPSLTSPYGSPWFLTSDVIVHHTKPFLRASKDYMRSIKKDYTHLFNFVDARNTHAIRWIKWLGFEILPTQAYGPYDMMFHPFEMKR